MASGIEALIIRGRGQVRRTVDSDAKRKTQRAREWGPPAETFDKRFKEETIKKSQSTKTFPTGGDWTKSISYNPDEGEVTVVFKDGFVAVYPNMTLEDYQEMFRGANTKGKPVRGGSIGAWLHQHPNVMYNYRAGKK